MNDIEINGLKKSYKDFSLELDRLVLPQGCIMGLIGENGAGKSTTIRLLLDMIKRDSGDIRLLGCDCVKNKRELMEDVGVVLDEAGFPDCLTAGQVDKVMRNIYKRWDSGEYFSLVSRLDLPGDKPFKEFSKGMRMKLAIAVALSHSPRLLILDEPTSGLDPVVRDEVVDIFSDFAREDNHSVLISSHIVSDLEKLCDYIAFIHRGRLLLCQDKDRLLQEYGIFRCTAEELKAVDPAAVAGRRETPYGVTAVVRRDAVPSGRELDRITIEELFIAMVKEAR